MTTFIDTLHGLSSAEEFFAFLGVTYEPGVVRVNRLHILKRFHDYVADLGADLDEATIKAAYAGALERAYADFLTSDARKEKLFKVFQNTSTKFVPLTAVKRKAK